MNFQIRNLAVRVLPVLLLGVLCGLALAADDDATVSFTGTWKTLAGGGTPYTVVLKQTANKVTGTFSPGNGKIFEGVVVGRKLTFKWTQDPNFEGTGEFTLDEDGKGFVGSSTALKPKQFTSNWGTPRKPPAPFGGKWTTLSDRQKIVMTLAQINRNVTGTYAPNDGKISGTIDGKVLRFTWASAVGKGSGRFVMNDDNRSFSGSYNKGDNPDEVDGTWNGTQYVAVPFAGLWETASGGDYKYGVLLTQDGDKVTGVFAPGNGRITDGVIDDRKLRFKWTQDGGLSGSGHFILSEDGKSFKGTSNQTDDPDGGGNSWNGNRPAPSFGGTWDMRAGAGTPFVAILTQVGTKVTGTFSPESGTISGTQVGDQLILTWTQAGGFKGTGKLELTNGGQSWEGSMKATEGPNTAEVFNTATRRPTSFSGLWNLVSAGAYPYILTLRQDSDKLSGSFKAGNNQNKNGNGQITSGQALGDTAYFNWTQDGGFAGTGWIKMGARNRTFSGAFRNGNDAEIPCTATRDDKT